MKITLSMPSEAAASKTSKVPRTFRSKKSYEFFSPRSSWMPCQAAMWTMQSQPRNMPVSFARSRMDHVDKQRSLFQIPRRANVENDRRVALVEQPRYEGLAEISRPSGQKHLHHVLPNLPAFHRATRRQAGPFVGIEYRISRTRLTERKGRNAAGEVGGSIAHKTPLLSPFPIIIASRKRSGRGRTRLSPLLSEELAQRLMPPRERCLQSDERVCSRAPRCSSRAGITPLIPQPSMLRMRLISSGIARLPGRTEFLSSSRH